MITSGIRFGTPAITTRGFKEAESERVANLVADLLGDPAGAINAVREEVMALCAAHPVYL